MFNKIIIMNVKHSIKDYIIYFATLTLSVFIFYMFNIIGSQSIIKVLDTDKASIIKTLSILMDYISVFVSIILGFLIVYSNNFIIKKRNKELGTYQILGMKKSKVALMISFEIIIVGTLSLIIGILLGIIFSQLSSYLILKLFNTNMMKYKFIFSLNTIFKTVKYFGIMSLVSLLFNNIILSKYKLIDMIYADKKVSVINIKNIIYIITSFLLSIALITYSYYLIIHSNSNTDILKILISNIIGIIVFFIMISSIMFFLLKLNKKRYYKNINLFSINELSSKFKMMISENIIISYMLLITIIILSSSLSLIFAFNKNLNNNNITDFTIMLDNDDFYGVNKYSEDYASYTMYQSDDILISNVLINSDLKRIKKDYGKSVNLDVQIPIIKKSDYYELMNLYNENFINIKDNEYVFLANSDMLVKCYDRVLKSNNEIIINNTALFPGTNKSIMVPMQNFNTNVNNGVLVINDYLTKDLDIYSQIIVGNYKNKYSKYNLKSYYKDLIITKDDIINANTGITMIISFIGIYIGIIFLIASCSIITVNILSIISNDAYKYKILKKIGVSNKSINKNIMLQCLILFLFPLVISILNSLILIHEINKTIKLMVSVNIFSNIILTIGLILVIYLTYFIITYNSCKKTITAIS